MSLPSFNSGHLKDWQKQHREFEQDNFSENYEARLEFASFKIKSSLDNPILVEDDIHRLDRATKKLDKSERLIKYA